MNFGEFKYCFLKNYVLEAFYACVKGMIIFMNIVFYLIFT